MRRPAMAQHVAEDATTLRQMVQDFLRTQRGRLHVVWRYVDSERRNRQLQGHDDYDGYTAALDVPQQGSLDCLQLTAVSTILRRQLRIFTQGADGWRFTSFAFPADADASAVAAAHEPLMLGMGATPDGHFVELVDPADPSNDDVDDGGDQPLDDDDDDSESDDDSDDDSSDESESADDGQDDVEDDVLPSAAFVQRLGRLPTPARAR